MKKIISILSILWLSLLIVGCTPPESTKVTLPDLTGLNKEQVIEALEPLDITYTFEDVIDNTKTRNRFIEYKGDYNIGDEVERGTSVVITFAIHANILPNLTGVHKDDIPGYFTNMKLYIEYREYETNSVPEGQFVKYLEPKYTGQKLDDNTTVVIFVAKNFVVVERDLIISKYIEGATSNKAIELYNISSEPVDLSKYKIGLFYDGSETVSETITLNGVLNPSCTYVISHTGSSAEILSKADLSTDKLNFNGNDIVTLMFYNDEVVDSLGTIGWALDIFNNITLIRNTAVNQPTSIFVRNEWDTYAKDYIEPLGTHPVSYPTTFTWDLSYASIPFETPGGMIQVSFESNYDGDTAYFTPGFLGEQRLRFIGIDTPEMGSGVVATQAKSYVYNKLRYATTIYIQHDPRSGRVDSYERQLGLVWYDGKLLNYELVLYGYSQNNYSDDTQSLIFSGIPLAVWMANAEVYAKQNHLGVWG
ncbi:lamin tail domain-containing protein [Paracholeplasma manati]|uniref:lamin tail domain-containing protein n=1 Tax=Paracholeplasma manati TaxID=591373 RepID=UPI002407C604|nr:lamin tail domain-containing protein [Paracholeplasma manati]MDG0889436.1 lamin tail domain-containing protein [Paracholeplasma manati]